ncbi:ROK family protein [uncultured Clostridium sp.]|uniref:ROK family protein n=1 Tax=uncultured Clostridium sp. TaxID=59620 RepID=UPI002614CE1E|nr:ROK family protein [uncultured Clostridium sp.]
MKKFIAIDIGGTNIKFGVIGGNLEIIESGTIKTRKNENENFILEDIDSLISELIKRYEILKIGISTAGVVDVESGKIVYAGSTIPGYTGTEIKSYLENKYKIEVRVENDVNAAALGENLAGAGMGSNSLFMITIGTGIGGALVLNNEIFYGNSNSAGEIGYMRFNGEEIQDIASTTSLVNNVNSRLGKNLNGKEIFDLAEKGNEVCIEEIDNILEKIVELILNIIYIINPQTIILGGGIMERRDYVEKRIKGSLEKILPRKFYETVNIELAKLGNKAGLIGAVSKFV